MQTHKSTSLIVLGWSLILLLTWPAVGQARIIMWEEDFDDGDTNCWTLQTTGAALGLDSQVSHSGSYSLEISGNAAPGQGAIACSRVVQLDFTRDYTLQFAFRYADFHWDRFAIFGHIRLLLDYPHLGLRYDPIGDNSFDGNTVGTTSFQDLLPAGTWGWITVHCRPSEREYAVFVDGSHAGTVGYEASVQPSSQFWFEDNHSDTNFLDAHYDDLTVTGFLDPYQCSSAFPGGPFDPDDCAAWVNPPRVPFHGQYTTGNAANHEPCSPGRPNGRCVVACLHMLFDYYGDTLPLGGGINPGPQEAIEAAANTNARGGGGPWSGTTYSDSRRAGHFSLRTQARSGTRAGCPPIGAIPAQGANGYSWRDWGYAALDSVWTDLAPADTVDESAQEFPANFETLIASGYPLMVFINPENYCDFIQPDAYEGMYDDEECPPEDTDAPGHAILMIGYDNLGTWPGNPLGGPGFLLHDPALGRFLWIPQQAFWDQVWTSKRFTFAAPWELTWLAPAVWCFGAEFEGTTLVSYPGPAPLDGVYPVDSVAVTLALSNIGRTNNEVLTHAVDGITDSGGWSFSTWNLRFSLWTGGPATASVTAEVGATLSPAASATSYPRYADRLGGEASASRALERCLAFDPWDPGHHGWPYSGQWWHTAGGSGLRQYDLGGSLRAVYVRIANFGSEPIPAGSLCELRFQDPTLAARAPGGIPIGAETLPALASGDTLTLGPFHWTAPPGNAFGQPYFTLLSTIMCPADPPESDWPQDENNYAVLSDFRREAAPGEIVTVTGWVENPASTAMEVVLATSTNDGASDWGVACTPPSGVALILGPGEMLPAELHVTPTCSSTQGCVHLHAFLYAPGGELVRETGGLALTLGLPGCASVPGDAGGAGSIHLAQNEPNPFTTETTIRFIAPKANAVHLRIYDVAGRVVRTLAPGAAGGGWQAITWHGEDDRGQPLGNGVFFYRLETADGLQMSRRMLLLKR